MRKKIIFKVANLAGIRKDGRKRVSKPKKIIASYIK